MKQNLVMAPPDSNKDTITNVNRSSDLRKSQGNHKKNQSFSESTNTGLH
jgi:hypothetical protein